MPDGLPTASIPTATTPTGIGWALNLNMRASPSFGRKQDTSAIRGPTPSRLGVRAYGPVFADCAARIA
jgi:hypothetical protein